MLKKLTNFTIVSHAYIIFNDKTNRLVENMKKKCMSQAYFIFSEKIKR